MKSLRMLGPATLVAFVALACVAVSPAGAESTALCERDESECPPVDTVTHLHATTLSGSKVKLLSSVITVECDALFLGDATVNLASPLVTSGNFTYSNCANKCTMVEENGPATVTALRLGHETADVTIGLLVHFTCSGLNCYYSGEVLGTAKGPLLSTETNGEGSFQEQTLPKEKGLFCPATAKLDAIGVPLSPIYFSS